MASNEPLFNSCIFREHAKEYFDFWPGCTGFQQSFLRRSVGFLKADAFYRNISVVQ